MRVGATVLTLVPTTRMFELRLALDVAETAIANVRALHHATGASGRARCDQCMEPWPCRTARAVDAVPVLASAVEVDRLRAGIQVAINLWATENQPANVLADFLQGVISGVRA